MMVSLPRIITSGMMRQYRLIVSSIFQLLMLLLVCLLPPTSQHAAMYDDGGADHDVTRVASPMFDIRHVMAVFEADHVTTRRHLLRNALTTSNARRHASVHLSDVTLLALPSAYDMLVLACDAIQHHNVTAVLAFTHPATTNVLYTVTRYLGIPLIAYNDELKTPSIAVSSLLVTTAP